MTLWRCNVCATVFGPGLPYCPGCTRTDVHKEGSEPMPKITRENGPSYKEDAAAASEERPTDHGAGVDNDGNRGGQVRGDEGPRGVESEPRPLRDGEQADIQQVEADKTKTEAEEAASSPGNSSKASSEKPVKKQPSKQDETPSPAPTTANRSSKDQKGATSTAPSAGTTAARKATS